MARVARVIEPPLCSGHFLVGRDGRGCWTVRDDRGLVGGIFVSRQAALHFAREESNRLPGAVICMPDDVPVTVDLLSASAQRTARRTAVGRR